MVLSEHLPVVKLIRTDTTLDLSHDGKKKLGNWKGPASNASFIHPHLLSHRGG